MPFTSLLKKYIAIIGLLACAGPSTSEDLSHLWKCTEKGSDSILYTNAPIKGKDCKLFSKVFTKEEIANFRRNLKPGDMSDKGLVIEVKPPLAKVQEKKAERWHRVSDLSPIVE